jgi:hypothetical protein
MQSLVGTWRLIEDRAFDESGNEMPPPLGPNPMGIILYDAERMIVVVCDGRLTMPESTTERSFVSYAGAYQFDGEKLVVRVDGASSPAGFADQVRQISFCEPNRYVATLVDGSSGRRKLTWERIGLAQSN